jgi:hypothetical protein
MGYACSRKASVRLLRFLMEDMAEYPALFVELLSAFDSSIRMESDAFQGLAERISK